MTTQRIKPRSIVYRHTAGKFAAMCRTDEYAAEPTWTGVVASDMVEARGWVRSDRMTAGFVNKLSAVRKTPGGEVLFYTDAAAIFPVLTGDKAASEDTREWFEIAYWVRTHDIALGTYRYMRQLAPRGQANAPEHVYGMECGPCCESMQLSDVGIMTADIVTLQRRYDPEDNGTTGNDLVRMARDHGRAARVVTYESAQVPDAPAVCLGPYAFRDRSRLHLPSFYGNHWIYFRRKLDDGRVLVGDSLYRDETGADMVWTMDEWLRFWIRFNDYARVSVQLDERNALQRLVGSGARDIPDWIFELHNDRAPILAGA